MDTPRAHPSIGQTWPVIDQVAAADTAVRVALLAAVDRLTPVLVAAESDIDRECLADRLGEYCSTLERLARWARQRADYRQECQRFAALGSMARPAALDGGGEVCG